jgi:hypothetical protein
MQDRGCTSRCEQVKKRIFPPLLPTGTDEMISELSPKKQSPNAQRRRAKRVQSPVVGKTWISQKADQRCKQNPVALLGIGLNDLKPKKKKTNVEPQRDYEEHDGVTDSRVNRQPKRKSKKNSNRCNHRIIRGGVGRAVLPIPRRTKITSQPHASSTDINARTTRRNPICSISKSLPNNKKVISRDQKSKKYANRPLENDIRCNTIKAKVLSLVA